MKILVTLFLLFIIPVQAQAGMLDIKEITSKSGITAWLVEDHNVPVIAMEFAFKGAGSKQDPANKQGLVRLLSNTLDEGAGDMDSQSFQKELQDLSITLRFSASRDDLSGSLKTVTRNKSRAFELLKLALTEPRFDEEPVNRMRKANQARIRSSLSDPDWIAARLINDRAYEGHVYAQNSGGTLTTLEAITARDLKDYAAKSIARDNLHIAVAGDITAAQLSKILDQVFGDLPETPTLQNINDTPLQNQGETILFEKDIPQTIIQIIQPGISRQHPDFHTAQIMNFVLGSSGFGSRLTEEIREKRGLTYGIYSYFQELDHVNSLQLTTSTANENVLEMMALIRAEWDKMLSEPISADELATARTYLIGSLPLSLTSTDRIAGMLLSMKRDGLPIDYLSRRETAIQNATPEDVQRVARDLLAPETLLSVMVGKPENIKADIITDIITEIPNAE